MLPAEFDQRLVTSTPGTTAGPTDFGLAFRAELQRLPVALHAIVGTVHAALEGDAVRDAQQVARFMDGGPKRSLEKQSPFRRRAIHFPIPRQRPDADSLRERRLAKHEIPILSRPKILRREPEHGDRILWTLRLQYLVEQMR